ncbi:DUF438 domain-containing protein [Virgibacillus sp. MSJ-26]|uniref:DUF438 domain-containing protein n=1 Tax=Virgibacillus sp. MSJ-26 TaxID=2841522 RepID=UPI001C11D98C|nr:DUF438 domain-containing protein [Virgibacillus sp. MSJ-26]MBU5467842.1 DUF438 domain-containing protein [Virgibacillus sp. MSJ-26]
MANAQFNTKLVNILKDILLRLRHDDSPETIQKDFDQNFKHISDVEILLIIQELKSGDHGISSQDVVTFFNVFTQIYGRSINDWYINEINEPGHPVQIFLEENKVFRKILDQINNLVKSFEEDKQFSEEMLEQLKEQMVLLGQFYNHYNRKEKLFFPIFERYGHYTPSRIMWGDDDRIRTLYKGTKQMMEKVPNIDFKYVKKSYDLFESKFREVLFEEESFLLPIVVSLFNEDDWLAIAKESDAFGFAVEPEGKWMQNLASLEEKTDLNNEKKAAASQNHLAFKGGFLTVKEADNIFNNLPLEITFVDKNGFFKYFNDRVKSSEMMFVRTPSSIGRNVANCHPPKSFKKVMSLIHDLKSRRRASETMWFKKKDKYVHITYKGVFDEDGEYLGILEYVQDIQPFLDLPREVKKELSKLEH